MTEPRLIFLSSAPLSVPDQQVPPGWCGWGADRNRAFEVAPGIRIALIATGNLIVPGGTVAQGAGIAVWTETKAGSRE